MNILYDLISLQPVANIAYHGGGEYCKKVFFELVKNVENEKIFVLLNPDKEIKSEILSYCKLHNIIIFYIKSKNEMKEIFKNNKIDIFFFSNYNEIFTCEIPTDVKVIFACHDMRILEVEIDSTLRYYGDPILKERIKSYIKILFRFIYKYYINLTYKRKLLNLLKRADAVLTLSYFSKYSIVYFFPEINLKKIKVYYAPQKECEFAKNNKSIIQEKYFLMISIDRFEKNSYRAIKAFDNIFSRYDSLEYKVVCVGKANKKMMKSLNHKEKFIFYNYLESEKLECLYKYAYAFIFPSINEGFGYPPLEAMKYGRLILSSGVTSMPELYENSAIYFDPFSVRAIENVILYSLFEDVKSLKKRSIQQYCKIKRKQDEDLKNIVKQILNKN